MSLSHLRNGLFKELFLPKAAVKIEEGESKDDAKMETEPEATDTQEDASKKRKSPPTTPPPKGAKVEKKPDAPPSKRPCRRSQLFRPIKDDEKNESPSSIIACASSLLGQRTPTPTP